MTYPIPNNECLGRGYDVFGCYASPTSTTEQLFELGESTTLLGHQSHSYMGFSPEVATYQQITQTLNENIFGNNID